MRSRWTIAAVATLVILALPCGAKGPALAADIDAAFSYLLDHRADGRFDAGTAPLVAEAAIRRGFDLTQWPNATHPVRADIVLPQGTALMPLLRPAYVLGLADGAVHPEDPIPRRVREGLNGTEFGDAGLLNDDIWAVLALRAWGPDTQPAIVTGAANILAHQNPDGGWGWRMAGPSDVDTTGMALSAVAGLAGAGAARADAAQFLASVADPAGGFPTEAGGTPNCDSTVWAMRGMATIDAGTVRSEDFAFLARLHGPDGGYAYTTGGPSNLLCTAEVAAWLSQALDSGVDTSGYDSSQSMPVPPAVLLAALALAAFARKQSATT